MAKTAVLQGVLKRDFDKYKLRHLLWVLHRGIFCGAQLHIYFRKVLVRQNSWELSQKPKHTSVI